MLALVISNFMANALALFCKFSKVTSFLYLLCNLTGCILMSLLLKFTHMQAEVMKVMFDIGPIPAMYDGVTFRRCLDGNFKC